MTLMISITLVLMTLLIAAVASVKVPRTRLSKYELKRLVGQGDTHAITQQSLETYRNELYSLQRILTLLLLLVSFIVALTGLGVAIGSFVSLAIVLLYAPLARMSFLAKFPQAFFDNHTETFVNLIAKSSIVRGLLKAPHTSLSLEPKIHSPEELAHVIEQSGTVLTASERDLLLHALRFDNRTVKELMVPSAQVATIKKSELLGPLVLDDLHKTGHDLFPVIDKDINAIVGVLHLGDLLTIDAGKRSTTAEKAMVPGVTYIKSTASLRQAFGSLLIHHQPLLIVADEAGETLGLLTIKDITESLFGRRLDEEFTPDVL